MLPLAMNDYNLYPERFSFGGEGCFTYHRLPSLGTSALNIILIIRITIPLVKQPLLIGKALLGQNKIRTPAITWAGWTLSVTTTIFSFIFGSFFFCLFWGIFSTCTSCNKINNGWLTINIYNKQCSIYRLTCIVCQFEFIFRWNFEGK
jgi:hypothetical protein